jgi:hypothetical protein
MEALGLASLQSETQYLEGNFREMKKREKSGNAFLSSSISKSIILHPQAMIDRDDQFARVARRLSVLLAMREFTNRMMAFRSLSGRVATI